MGYSYLHKTQYYETDQMGVVHHSNYIRWFEEARTAFLENMGYPYERMEQEGIISPVLRVECDYRKMVRYGGTVRIEVSIEKFNGIKLVVGYRIFDTNTDELCTSGRTSHCFLNKEGRPVSVKKVKPDFYKKITIMSQEES
ncbi:MAG: thioesterase family protein [Lachnospiraceae bacterium]